ncbi:hypothetical protein D3C72_1648430 [compost metagenome]
MDEHHLPLRVLYCPFKHADHWCQPHTATDQDNRCPGVDIDMEAPIRRRQLDLIPDIDVIMQQVRNIAWGLRPASFTFDGDPIAAPVWHVREAVLADLLQPERGHINRDAGVLAGFEVQHRATIDRLKDE